MYSSEPWILPAWSLWAVLEDGQGHPSRPEAAEREEEVTDILGPGSMENQLLWGKGRSFE